MEKINEPYSPDWIDYELDSSKDLLFEKARYWVSEFLSFLPKNVIEFVIENIVFISAPSEGSYFSFSHVFFQNMKGFILFNDDLWNKSKIEMAFTIAHEVAHAYRGDSELEDFEKLRHEGKGPPKCEIEADKLAVQWLSKHFPKEKLLKCCSYLKSPNNKKGDGRRLKKGGLKNV